MIEMKGMIVLITGVSAGIGAACAKLFNANGAKLIGIARRKERLVDLAKVLKGEDKVDYLLLECDIRDSEQLKQMLENLPPEWKNVDILVNNAGLARGMEPFDRLAVDEIDEVIDTNVRALMKLSRYLLPTMIQRQKGHIINIGSIAGHEAYPGGSVYNTSKFAVRGFTEALRMDLVKTPLRVTAIDPGMVETEFSLTRFRGDSDKAKNVYKGLQALSPEDVAESVYFAASRPAHVSINEIILMPVKQASALVIHREITDN
ncbi:MAG TPA: SDR family NAD(P)-dependent oxidoreductase [Candidatus Marinimicrobia bacterium]|nr:SDR family NAD(P)-dependent oxidoreductase [Candidatus Neomarinimicrobiota bacterium]